MKLEKGEIVTLSNNREYICISTVTEGDNDYVYLLSNFKPVEVMFVKQKIVNNEVQVTVISNQEEKQKVFNLFQNQIDIEKES